MPRRKLMELYAVELRTERWDEVLAWYREVLGVRVAVRIPEDQYALLIAGQSRIALMGRTEVGANRRISLAFEVTEMDEVERRLKAHQTEFSRVADHPEGLAIINTADPDGNTIKLFRWPPP